MELQRGRAIAAAPGMWHVLREVGAESEHDSADTHERTMKKAIRTGDLLASIRDVVRQSRKAVAYGVNTAMVLTNYDRKVKLPDENPTAGILLCKEKNDALVKSTLPKDNRQIFARRYQLYLPTKAQLRAR